MPDLTTASAMPWIMSSLTLQANLFHEFHPMGGVGASAPEFTVFSCAGRPAVTAKTAKATNTTNLFVFMRCFYQNGPPICTAKVEARQSATGGDKCDYNLAVPLLLPFQSGGFSMDRSRTLWLVALVGTFSFFSDRSLQAQTPAASVGVFESHSDLGNVLHPGSLEYDNSKQTYT